MFSKKYFVLGLGEIDKYIITIMVANLIKHNIDEYHNKLMNSNTILV